MTHASQDRQESRVFTHNLSHVMLFIIFAFIALNIFAVESCRSQYLHNGSSSVCNVFDLFAPLRHAIPAIYVAADFLEARGDQERADLVVAAYSFSWGSFLVFGALMIAVAVIRVRLLGDQDREKYLSWLAQQNQELELDRKHADRIALGTNFFLFAIAICLIFSFLGSFNFDNYSVIGNMVHERDRDLYQPTVFLSMILVFLIFFINGRIKMHFSRPPA